MSTKIRMEYGVVEELAQRFGLVGAGLLDFVPVLKAVATRLEDEGLVSAAGDTLVEAIREPLISAINQLSEMMYAQQRELNEAVQEAREAEAKAAGRFRD